MTKNIPWEFSNLPDSSRLWRWKTQHFDVQVRTEGGGTQHGVVVLDLTRGRPIPDFSVIALSFKEAEYEVLNFIGKAYPRALGYREYAGDIATTFEIGTGQRINFALLEGHQVLLVITDSRRVTQRIEGTLSVVNHSIEIRLESGKVASIPPLLIQEIGGAAYGRVKNELIPRDAKSRVVEGTVLPGCTGEVGFKSRTVIHGKDAGYCPRHKV